MKQPSLFLIMFFFKNCFDSNAAIPSFFWFVLSWCVFFSFLKKDILNFLFGGDFQLTEKLKKQFLYTLHSASPHAKCVSSLPVLSPLLGRWPFSTWSPPSLCGSLLYGRTQSNYQLYLFCFLPFQGCFCPDVLNLNHYFKCFVEVYSYSRLHCKCGPLLQYWAPCFWCFLTEHSSYHEVLKPQFLRTSIFACKPLPLSLPRACSGPALRKQVPGPAEATLLFAHKGQENSWEFICLTLALH